MSRTAPVAVPLRIGHSPDPDDAFMWFPLLPPPRVDTGRYAFTHVLEDIQSLNERSAKGELEITALSIAQYPFVASRYALTTCGASMGEGYGPMIVARTGRPRLSDLPSVKIAVPGERTSAFLALSLFLRQRVPRYEVVMFDQIIPRVASGEFDAGLIIHEGQLTYRAAGLECLIDLGQWWTDTRKLPLPLGGNAIRRDLGAQAMREVCTILLASIRHALEHREEAVTHAMTYARDMGRDLADRFVGMYVNDLTLDYGPRGRDAIRLFLAQAAELDLVPACGEIDFIAPL